MYIKRESFFNKPRDYNHQFGCVNDTGWLAKESHGKSIILCKKSVNSVFSIVELSLRQCAKDTWLSHICKFSLSPRHSITKILIQYQCNYSQLKQSTVQKKTQKHIKHIPGQFFSYIGEKKTQNNNLKSTVQKKHKNTQNTCLSHFFVDWKKHKNT